MTVSVGEYKGTVKFFQHAKGFGFIYPEAEMAKENENERDNVFFHCSDIVTPGEGNGGTHSYTALNPGDIVTFDVTERETRGEGPRLVAVNVALVSRAKVQRQTMLAPNNVTLGIKKSHVPLMRSFIGDVMVSGTEMSDAEKEMLNSLKAQLEHAEAKMQAQRDAVHAGAESAQPPAAAAQPASKKVKGKREASEASSN